MKLADFLRPLVPRANYLGGYYSSPGYRTGGGLIAYVIVYRGGAYRGGNV